ncbi:hypothetical protein CAR_c11060 [Carnobacterium sp. 17-4]|uniref:toll/interleukin-1 receptor domain-containing protein n=1 Tax=Carnobacterium sp. (strain 17-4) TaxID=208596 RepID=UPI0002059238|nr:toll/interleukin-1 receptor domain-containing protein [Carnobacterium sp. 17-4]AEB29798.1 hypothetical protein CAR_c11060 [Carnobacterium sp. 17-4]
MKKIFEQGEFKNYSQHNLNEARASIKKSYQFSETKTTIFISHKHDELENLKDILGFLEKNFDVKVYIDSKDPSLPTITSGETASRIKKRINDCDKFILLATNGAIESKWCNWELGFGDAKKFEKNIALFPMKPAETSDWSYKGSEYMSIYPYITFFDGSETDIDGNFVPKGYYIFTDKKDGTYITSFKEWLLEK